ncbi:hypothetical protein BRC93_06815 [Halobacteriales archaeon QS_5_70_15]|nr:MAG: hypothetical protein BRC93_06815 [Halobacteriales archaeon QS_5_70_15]
MSMSISSYQTTGRFARPACSKRTRPSSSSSARAVETFLTSRSTWRASSRTLSGSAVAIVRSSSRFRARTSRSSAASSGRLRT